MKVELKILEEDDNFKYKNHLITLCYDSDANCNFYDVDNKFDIYVPFEKQIEHVESYLRTLKQAIEYIDKLEVIDESL